MRAGVTASPRAPALMLPRWLLTGLREARSEAEATAAEESAEAMQVAEARPRAAGEGAAVGRGAPGRALAPGSVAERLTPAEGAPLPHSPAWPPRRRELTELRERLRARVAQRAAEPGGRQRANGPREAEDGGARGLDGCAALELAAVGATTAAPGVEAGGRGLAGGRGAAEQRQEKLLEPGGVVLAERAAAGTARRGGCEAAAAMRRAVFDEDGDVRLELSR